MSITRILLITLVISSAIVILALTNLDGGISEDEDAESAPATAASAPAEGVKSGSVQTLPSPPPPLAMPGSEELSPEDAEVEREQIQEAMKLLSSPTETERVEAVEQLGAYPNPQTEVTLTQILAGDSSADVRNAAALSLGSLENPSPATISTLMGGLKDASEDVRYSALSTLEDFLLSQEENTPLYINIRNGLESMSQTGGMPEDLKESIAEVLKGQVQPGSEPVR